MTYIDHLVAWGDQLFRRDTIETVNVATQLYILAVNTLAPRPEAIPPVVSPPPLDPALLLRGLTTAGDIGAALADLNSPPPALRFGRLLRLALSVTEDLRHFRHALLGALEERDAEALAGLQATHEVNQHKVLCEIDVVARTEAEAERQAIERGREALRSRRSRLEAQEPLNDRERLVRDALGEAICRRGAGPRAGVRRGCR